MNLRHQRSDLRDSSLTNPCVCSVKKVDLNFTSSQPTFEADGRVRQMAKDLEDDSLIAKISGGDLIALEAKYHLECLTSYRNRHRSVKRAENRDTEEEDKKVNESRALRELLTHIETCVEEGESVFKLSELFALYQSRLHNLGIVKEVNRSRLKEAILKEFPEAVEQNLGRNVMFLFKASLLYMLHDMHKIHDL